MPPVFGTVEEERRYRKERLAAAFRLFGAFGFAEGAWWFITMERSCQAQLLAMAAGAPKHIDRDTASLVRGQIGGHIAGWVQAQPLFDRITAAEPDHRD
ncbi:class II aldolase/adducin head domain-containing protein [Streptomyces malaysiensis]|uniref:hypothetical protein n=1 Tax=Streptomyces malaysiensis TaxID=92644 RepID=UPI002B30FE32|nr:hypothetical protein R8789_04425 [Streptomyces malaysiensis]